jgi:ATP-dependent protease HslVU (ClpYQ) peptidase subunit
MNCIEFRRLLLTDPGLVDAEFVEHRRSCPDCAEAVERSAHCEWRLRQAVNIDVPENLASRILLKQSFEYHADRPWWRTRRAYALAASMLLMVGLISLGLSSYLEQQRLNEEFVALVNGAPYALAASKPVSGSEISAALEPVGLDLAGDIGAVTYAGRCIVRGKLSGHIVVQGDTAPVTVFLIGEQLVADRATIRSNLYSGIVVRQGAGTIAIVSTPGESLEKVEARIRSAIRWTPMQDA